MRPAGGSELKEMSPLTQIHCNDDLGLERIRQDAASLLRSCAGCSICFFGENFDRWLFRETVMNNIAIIGTVVGALFIGFSREKIEDEMIQHIRLNALMAAMWINYLLLIVVSLSIYNINYLTVMACGMATPLVIFLLVYHFNLYRLNRNLHHEK